MMISTLFCIVASASGASLLDEVQHRAVSFFWNESSSVTGFTKDRASNADGVDTHNIASCAAVGYALIAYPIGVEHKWLDRRQALERTRATLSHLLTDWQQSHGWLYHFADWQTGERQWRCEASSIDTSLCLAGILFAERYWKDSQVTRDAQKFENRIDWNWMLTDGGKKPDAVHLCMGWHPENGFINSRWSDFNEAMLLYIQAYGLADITNAGWDKIRRPEERYKGLDLITGGPLFMHEMSEGFYDFRGQRDRLGYDYSIEERNAALANRQYCIDNPKNEKGYGPDFWGLNASDGPDGYNAFGAPGWISDDGTVCPTAPLAAMPAIPKEALSFAAALRRDYPAAWGKYGFPDSLNPTRNWIDQDVLGLDLGMMLCAVENARSGLIWRINSANPIIRRGFERAGFKKAVGDPRLRVETER
jgi:hypothetical protein